MSVKQLTEIVVGVGCHAWNADRSEVAFSPCSNQLVITTASTLEEKFTKNEHDMIIAAIDWHPTSNKIVTCSHDRNAFVWNYDEAAADWKPSLVLLRIMRAALDVKFSPNGEKFAVASSAKCVPVCYFEAQNNWWVSKMIKKHKSSVLSVSWHPNSQIVATGSSDFKARVFCAYIADVDAAQDSGGFPEVPFGEIVAEFTCAGWVHSVAYSPSGATLAFCGHDSSIHFASFGGGEPVVQTIRFSFLPLMQLIFLSETSVVGAGHDMNPAVFAKSDAWSFSKFVDEKTKAKEEEVDANSVGAKMAMWQNKDKMGQAGGAATDDSTAWLKHQAAITCLKPYGPNQFSTSAADGRLITWSL